MGNIVKKLCINANEEDEDTERAEGSNDIVIPLESYTNLLNMLNDANRETIEIKENIKSISYTLETIQCRIGFIENNNIEGNNLFLIEHKKIMEFMENFKTINNEHRQLEYKHHEHKSPEHKSHIYTSKPPGDSIFNIPKVNNPKVITKLENKPDMKETAKRDKCKDIGNKYDFSFIN